MELDLSDIKKFFEFLNHQEGSRDSTERLLLWLMLGEAIIECQPKTKDMVLEFLLKKDLDVRYLTQYFDKDLDKEFTRMALEHKGVSEEEILKIKGKDELEKKLNEVLYNVRQTEKDKSLTPFEGRIISLYRLIRFSTLIRRVLKK